MDSDSHTLVSVIVGFEVSAESTWSVDAALIQRLNFYLLDIKSNYCQRIFFFLNESNL